MFHLRYLGLHATSDGYGLWLCCNILSVLVECNQLVSEWSLLNYIDHVGHVLLTVGSQLCVLPFACMHHRTV